MSISEMFEYANGVSAIIGASATAVLAYLAWRGLGTWKKQLVANKRYGIAKNLVVVAGRFKEAIQNYYWEAYSALEPDIIDENFQPNDAYRHAIRSFLKTLPDADTELKQLRLESGAVLGKNVVKSIDSLLYGYHELLIARELSLLIRLPGEERIEETSFFNIFNYEKAEAFVSKTDEAFHNLEVSLVKFLSP